MNVPQVLPKTKQWLLTGALKELDHDVAPVDDTVAIWSIGAARDAAWVRAQVLWHLRDHQTLTDAYLAAFAIVASRRLVTLDRGFRQFRGLDLDLLGL